MWIRGLNLPGVDPLFWHVLRAGARPREQDALGFGNGSPDRREKALGVRHSRVRGRRGARALGGLVTTVTLGAWLVLAAVPASADLTACASASLPITGATVTLTLDGAVQPDTIGRDAAGLLTVDGVALAGACSGASVNNTDTIVVNGADADSNDVVLALANGGFVGSDGNEVDIVLALGAGAGVDELTIDGSSGADNIRFGASGINLTGDDDADVTGAATAEIIEADGNDGDDIISGAGGLGTGTVFTADLDDIEGDAGNDTLTGGSGDDTLEGKDGNDIIDGGAGDDFDLDGDAGNDVMSGGSGDDDLDGGVGDDILNGNDGIDDLDGDDGKDTLDGGSGADFLDGDAGDDMLIGGTGDDDEDGGVGDDTYEQGTSSNGSDDLDDSGGDDGDKVTYAGRTSAVTVTFNGLFDDGETDEDDNVADTIDIVVGGTAADSLTGDAGDQTFEGGPGADTLDPGAGGDDTLSYAGSAAGVSVDLATDSDATTAGVQPTVSGGDAQGDLAAAGWDNVTGSGSTDTLIGDAASNVLTGGAGDDMITGAAGDDILHGGAGSDTYNEGTADSGEDLIGDDTTTAADEDAGSDTVDYSGRTTAVVVTTKAGGFNDGEDSNGDGVADEDDDVETENVWGGSGADTITGDAGDNTIAGNAGADTLDGAAGTDTADYSADTAGVTVNLSTSTAAGGDAEGDTVANFENATGGAGNDSLTGSNGENTLTGGAGNDKLVGRGDDDTLAGGDGKDTVNYSGSASGVVVNLKTGVGAGITEGTDTLVGIENATGTLFRDTLTGNNARNVLRGGGGTDKLNGAGGNDRLFGGGGNDRLNGGKGKDFGHGGPGRDTCRSIEKARSC